MCRMLTTKPQDSAGALSRLTGILSRRQANIEFISVGRTMESNISRITIITDVESLEEAEQIIKQLNRLVDVLRVRDITDIPHLEREVISAKLAMPTSRCAEILAVIQPFHASVVDVAPKSITIQVTDDADRIETLLRVVKPCGIRNPARTGATGFLRDFS